MVAEESTDLLGEYRPPDAFFATAERTIVGTGIAQAWSEGTPDALADVVARQLAESDVPLALGAFPFDTSGSAVVVIPKAARIGGAARPGPGLPVRAPVRVRPVPGPEAHITAVAGLVRRIEASPLRKAVLARVLELEFGEPVSAQTILHNLVRDNPSAYSFAVELPQLATLIGASPELLLARTGTRVRSHPLAGSARRSPDPVADKENAANLVASAKNRDEHALVVEAVVAGLRPFCRDLEVPAEPALVATPTMWHLGTRISGELRDPDVSALRLAAALHPTPAVCGTPTEDARRVLTELEPFDRGYYAGMVGWVDAGGDGEWAVSIRCGEVSASTMRLYAGGGIVAASDPAAELDETSAKFQTLLRAMGLELTT